MKQRDIELAIVALAGTTALNALGGAAYGLSGAPAVPRAWLAGSPFSDYRLPSAVLGLGVGGTSSAAAVAAWRQSGSTPVAAYVAGSVLTGWIVAQVGVLGLRSPLQPIMAGVGVSLIGLARRLT